MALHSPKTSAAAKTWDGGCGVDTNWSCGNNWSDNIVPAAADTLTFNATSTNNSTVDSLFNATETVASITITTGYSGTLSLGTNLTVTGTLSQSTGIFTAGSQALTMGAFTLSGGTFTASSGTTNISGAITVTGSPTFNHNGGTVNLNGSTATIACNGITLNLITFNHTGTKTVSSGCTTPVGSNATIASTVTMNGTLSGTGTVTITTGTFTLGTTGSLSGFSGIAAGAALTINGTLNASSYTTFTVATTFTLGASSVFTAPAGTMSVFAVTFTTGFSFNANGGTVNFTGSTATIACNGATFNTVSMTAITGVKTISAGCTIPLGASPTSSNGITVNGTLSGSGTLTITTGTFTLGTTGTLSGFSGLSAGGSVTINGTLNAGSYTTFSVLNTLTLASTAVFTAPAGTLSLRTFTATAGVTFNANGGTVAANGISTATWACGGVTFNSVTVSAISGVLTVGADCTLPLGTNPVAGSGLMVNGTITGSGTITFPGSSTLTLNSGSSFTGFTGLSVTTLTIAGGTLNASTYTTFSISIFTLSSSGVFTAPSGVMNVVASFTTNVGTTFNHNNGTINLTGSGGIACNGALLNLVTITHVAGTRSVASGCTVPLGNNPSTTAAVSVTGTLSGAGTLTTAGTFTLNSGAVLSGFSGYSGANLTITGADLNVSSFVPFNVVGVFIVNTGSVFTAPSGTARFGSSFTISTGATFNHSNGTIIFDTGGGAITCNGATFNNVIFNFPGTGTRTIDSTCNIPLGNNPTITGGRIALNGTLSGTGTFNMTADLGPTLTMNAGGTLSGFNDFSILGGFVISGATVDMSTYTSADFNGGDGFTMSSGSFTAPPTMTLEGNIAITGGTFNHSNGTVTLDGSDQAISGTTTFYNLNKTDASASTLTFPSGLTQTILGTLTLKGASSSARLSLVSSAPGFNWLINAGNTSSVCYVDVTDSNNSGSTIVAYNSISNSTNTGWGFSSQDCPVPASTTVTPTTSTSSGTVAATPSPSSTATRFTANQGTTADTPTVEESTTEEVATTSEPESTYGQEQETSTLNQDPKTANDKTNAYLWWLFGILALGIGIIFLIFLIKRRKHSEEPNDVAAQLVQPASSVDRPNKFIN